MAVTTIASVLVSVASAAYLGTVFARDAFFGFAGVAAFWVFIFANVPYGDYVGAGDLVKYQYLLALALVAAVVAAALVKLLGTGRLFDVWMTRSPLVNGYPAGDLNIPVFLAAMAFAWLTTFFVVIAQQGSLWAGNITMSKTWAIVFAVLSGLLLAAMLVLAGIQKRTLGDLRRLADGVGLYYFFAFLVAAAAPIVVWHVPAFGSDVVRGIVAGATALVLDMVLLAIGYFIERSLVLETTTAGAPVATAYQSLSPHDGLYTGGSGLVLVIRIFLIGLVHGLIFLVGGLAGVAAASDAAAIAVFNFPYLLLLFVILGATFIVLYLLILVCLIRPGARKDHTRLGQFSRAAAPTNDDDAVHSPLLPATTTTTTTTSSRSSASGRAVQRNMATAKFEF